MESHTWSKAIAVREDILQRFVEPLTSFVSGVVLLLVFPILGFWLAVASICFFVLEQMIYDKARPVRERPSIAPINPNSFAKFDKVIAQT